VRLISLFAGVGGFDLGFERSGFTVVGQCEIDPHAQAVLKCHWPDVPLHGDITTLKGSAFGPAEVVTWGSPCQDLSLAGRRAGLKGERSGLFIEGIRFIRELREATNGEYPRFSVWENVPGALSSAAGRDFRAVLEAFLEAEVPMPRSGKWANAGVVRGNGREVAWRVLDSQHFGVAQRRRRVFVVTDFGGQRAAEVLLEREAVPGHTPQGRTPGQGITGALTGGTGSSSAGNPDDNRAQAGFLVPVGKAIAFAMRGRAEGNVPEASGERVSALRGSSGGSTRDMVATPYAVRRLMPVETERLQGMPDGWTELGHYVEQAADRDRLWNAKERRRPTPEESDVIIRKIADTHRYRLVGNAVTVNVAEWLGGKVAAALAAEELEDAA
jgi:DNA (cytosine-5)-methyltransferase 1